MGCTHTKITSEPNIDGSNNTVRKKVRNNCKYVQGGGLSRIYEVRSHKSRLMETKGNSVGDRVENQLGSRRGKPRILSRRDGIKPTHLQLGQ